MRCSGLDSFGRAAAGPATTPALRGGTERGYGRSPSRSASARMRCGESSLSAALRLVLRKHPPSGAEWTAAMGEALAAALGRHSLSSFGLVIAHIFRGSC